MSTSRIGGPDNFFSIENVKIFGSFTPKNLNVWRERHYPIETLDVPPRIVLHARFVELRTF